MLGLMGRPSKGERSLITARPDVELGDVIRRNAKMLNMSYGEYLVALAAHALGMPEHAPQPRRDTNVLAAFQNIGETPLLPSAVAPIDPATIHFPVANEDEEEVDHPLAS